MKKNMFEIIFWVGLLSTLGGCIWYLETHFPLRFSFLEAGILSIITITSVAGCALLIYWILVNLRICMPGTKTWFDHLIFFKGLWPIQKRRTHSRSRIMAQRLKAHAYHEECIYALKEVTQKDNERWDTTYIV